jgi:hypothetical protein
MQRTPRMIQAWKQQAHTHAGPSPVVEVPAVCCINRGASDPASAHRRPRSRSTHEQPAALPRWMLAQGHLRARTGAPRGAAQCAGRPRIIATRMVGRPRRRARGAAAPPCHRHPQVTSFRPSAQTAGAVSPALQEALSGVNLGDDHTVRQSVQQYYGEVRARHAGAVQAVHVARC